MDARGSLATLSLIVCAIAGCAPGSGCVDPPEEGPGEDQPLDITIDSLDIVHGALRVSATMVDGAADVLVRLGGDCAHREVGGGVSTLSTLVWSLGDNDLAEAIGCGLQVRARVREGAHLVTKLAELEVAVDVAASESNKAGDGPQLQSAAASETGVSLVFAPVARSARLTTGDSILEAAPLAPEDDVPAGAGVGGRFTVPRLDLARSVLRDRPLYLEGSAFATALSVAGTILQGEPAQLEVETPQEEPAEEAVDESGSEG